MTSPTAPRPGPHGGDGTRLAAALGVPVDDILDLSASLNPAAPDVAALVAGQLGAIARYPDARAATAALASAIGVDPGRLVVTNGGAEAIALVADHLGSGWVEEPEFSLYRRHLRTLDPAAGRWRSNPGNPSGVLAPPDDTAAVWDEAFWPLATGTWTRGDADRGAWVVGSLTKLWACPGLRIGYAIAPDGASAATLRRRQPRWSVNSIACAVVERLLADTDLPGWRDAIARLRVELADVLSAAGFAVDAADAPWVLVPHAGDLRERLATLGILVRDCASFDLPGTVRIAVPDEVGLDRFRRAVTL